MITNIKVLEYLDIIFSRQFTDCRGNKVCGKGKLYSDNKKRH